MVKSPPANAGDIRDMGSIPESGRSPGEGHGNPLQYFLLENPIDRGAWPARVHGVETSQTQLSMRTHAHTHARLIWTQANQNLNSKSDTQELVDHEPEVP